MATVHFCDICRNEIDSITGTITLDQKGKGKIKKECCKKCFSQLSRMVSSMVEDSNDTAIIPMKRRKA